MWKFECGEETFEFHTEPMANTVLRNHQATLGDSPGCTKKHTIIDDGKPCIYPGCEVRYIPKTMKDHPVFAERKKVISGDRFATRRA